jgi:hypothetical protein
MRSLIHTLDNAPWKLVALLQTAVFVSFHALALSLGLRFDMAPLGMFAHYADPVLLRTRLLESVFYLHVQPPLYNLALGAILKVFPGHEAPVFHALFLINGLALYLLVTLLQARLGVRKSIALATSTLFAMSPTFLVFEHVLVYTIQCATLLVIAALTIESYVRTRRAAYGWAFFISLFLLCGIRSMYHLGFYVLIACAVAAMARGNRRQVLWMALIPGVILFSFYAKNCVLFDKFSVFSFLGKSPWIKTVGNLPWEERVRLANEGKISKVSLVERFYAVEYYPPEIRNVAGYETIPVLRQTTKSTGEVNYNHLSQIAVSDIYLEDALYVIRTRPELFLCTTAWAGLTYFSPMPLTAPRLQWLVRAYNLITLKINIPVSRFIPQLGASRHVPYLSMLIGMPLLMVYGIWIGLRSRRISPAQRAAILFMAFTVLYVTALSIVVELAETNRYRFEIDPFLIAFLGLIASGKRAPDADTESRSVRTPR